MAADGGQAPHSVNWLERLKALPGSFDFHVALRRFDTVSPEAPRLGEAERPSEEGVRIGQKPSALFEGAEITDFSVPDDGSAPRLMVGFLGLWGPNGPLPSHLTEYAYERLQHAGDPTLARFVDVFHHRMLLLFHRAWTRARPTVAMDRPDADAFALYVGALMGLGLEATRHRGDVHDFVKLHYAPHFASLSRSADGLRDLVADYFGFPTHVEEFVGEWLDLPQDERWRLGASRETGSLGRVPLGRRIWSRSHKFRIVLGPLSAFDFEQMLPASHAVTELTSLVRLYAGDEWDWELRLVLATSVCAPMRLGGGGRLGWTTRLGSGPGVEVDLVVDPRTRRTQRIRKPLAAQIS
jgi:type VI secretion system protein ImpH